MQYTTYYEEQQQIDCKKYDKIKQNLLLGQAGRKFEEFRVRKLGFQGTEANDAIPQYYLCIKDQDEEQIYLEKKYIQNHICHRAQAKLSRAECESILRGDIQWMKGHREVLFDDFYLQATLNQLSPGRIVEYQREMIKCKDGCVIFAKKVNCILGGCRNLLEGQPMLIRCLDEDKVIMTCRKKTNLPNTIKEILQGRGAVNEDTLFAL